MIAISPVTRRMHWRAESVERARAYVIEMRDCRLEKSISRRMSILAYVREDPAKAPAADCQQELESYSSNFRSEVINFELVTFQACGFR